MKQLNFFNDAATNDAMPTVYWKLYVDGAARNNPGPAGAGISMQRNDQLVEKTGIFLGTKTNNQAEYLALIFGLWKIKKIASATDVILIISDSQLLVRQLKGEYRVKEPHLKPLFELANRMLAGITYDIAHVLREENEIADEQANEAIDKKIKPPSDFIQLLKTYEIAL